MSVKVDLRLTRLHRIAARIAPDVIDKGAHDWADAVAEKAKELAPVDTGALRASIHVEPGNRQGEYQVVADVPYAIYQEYGTSRQPAQPFLTPAWRQTHGLPFFARALAEMIR